MNKTEFIMKKLKWIASPLVVLSLAFFPGCNSTTTTINGNWVNNHYAYGGNPRSGAYEFTIGKAAYVGLGIGGTTGQIYLLDSWAFYIDSTKWVQVAPFPGLGRELSISFSLGGKGYVGLGYNKYQGVDSTNLSDFWEFDPSGTTTGSLSNGTPIVFQGSWKQLHNWPTYPRYNAVAFTTSTNAYVGTGYDGGVFYNDCWQYSPGTDSWQSIVPFPGDKREGAMTLTINGKVYYFGGDSNSSQEFDLWELDPATEVSQWVWTINAQQTTDNSNYNDFRTGVRRSSACAFTLNDLGYVVGGTINNSPTPLVYQFNPLDLTWIKMTSLERSARTQAVSFVLTPSSSSGLTGPTPRAFVATGTGGGRKLDECDEWQPTVAYNATD